MFIFMHLWLRLGIIQVNLASALALHKRSKINATREFLAGGSGASPGYFHRVVMPLVR